MGDTSDIYHGVLNACLWYAYDTDFLYKMIIRWSDKENILLIIEIKMCIIEGDPTYLVIILFNNYAYHKVICPIC